MLMLIESEDRAAALPASARRAGGLDPALLNAALDCIISMDADGRVLEFNPAAERVFGYTRDPAVGQELATLIIPTNQRDRHRSGRRRYLETGEGPML